MTAPEFDQQAEEARRVELADRKRSGVGEIDDRRVERGPGLLDPEKGVLIDHADAGIGERLAIQLGQGEKPRVGY